MRRTDRLWSKRPKKDLNGLVEKQRIILITCVNKQIKVKQSRYRPGVAQRVPGS
jgi:hypothetical protein